MVIAGQLNSKTLEAIDNKIIDRLSEVLKNILEAELKAGNKVIETFECKEGDSFPEPNAIMVFLLKPFMTPIQRNITDVDFRNVNDPHYWKAEYNDKKNIQYLCCKFDGPNFDLM